MQPKMHRFKQAIEEDQDRSGQNSGSQQGELTIEQ